MQNLLIYYNDVTMSQLESLSLDEENFPKCHDKSAAEGDPCCAEISMEEGACCAEKPQNEHPCCLATSQECVTEDASNSDLAAAEDQPEEIEISPDLFGEEDSEVAQNCSKESSEEARVQFSEPSDKGHGQHLDPLMKALEAQSDPEVKLQLAIEFMEKSLAQSGTPHFKSFWQVRNICLQLFKENVQPASRTLLWAKYSELSKEARRLKELLDEQSVFAVEQIEIAIQALEGEIEQLGQQSEDKAPQALTISCKALQTHAAFYQNAQYELDLLNKQASRINALRKELIKTEMRVRKKNQFFQRLSVAGDKVFPRRKELIKEMSGKFAGDIDTFVASNFSKEGLNDSLYFLREEIKGLQGMAKLLTLNTHAFTHTRMKLSQCWDQIKHLEKERKKIRTQQKAAFKQNVDAVLEKIGAFTVELQSGEISIEDGNKKFDEIAGFMRSVELGRDEIRFLRDQLNIAKKPLLDRAKSEEQLKQEQEQERIRAKRQKVLDLKQEIEQLLQSTDAHDADSLIRERDALLSRVQEASLIKTEKQELERLFKPFRDIISEKQDQAIMALSDDDRQALQQLQEICKQRKERRQEIKEQIESLRKLSGASGLGFEQAMEYNAQLKDAKERLEKMNQAVREIETKLAAVEKKI
jgi:hypothetical protein